MYLPLKSRLIPKPSADGYTASQWVMFAIYVLITTLVLPLFGVSIWVSVALAGGVVTCVVVYLVLAIKGESRTIERDEFEFLFREHPMREGVQLALAKKWCEGDTLLLHERSSSVTLTLVHMDGSTEVLYNGSLTLGT